MALAVINVGPGDEVWFLQCHLIQPQRLFYMLVQSKICRGKKRYFCIDPDDIIKKITKNTKAIIVVHLGVMSADMQRI